MATIPKEVRKLKIESAIEDRQTISRLSRHIGPSSMGHPCARYVWYKFRNYKRVHHNARTLRLFARGHREEPIVIADLEAAGIEIITTQEKAIFCYGHGNAYSDGRIRNVPDAKKTDHLLEIKTSNDRNFKEYVKHGVEKTNPTYWIQLQVYMCLFGLKRCLYVIVNKNTDERMYARYKYNRQTALDALDRADDIVFSDTKPVKTESFKCRWCSYADLCNGSNTEPFKSCRSCVHSAPVDKDGEWICRRKKTNGKRISFKKQIKGCKKYAPLL